MPLSSVFIMDLKGRIIISKNYRGDVSTSCVSRCVFVGSCRSRTTMGTVNQTLRVLCHHTPPVMDCRGPHTLSLSHPLRRPRPPTSVLFSPSLRSPPVQLQRSVRRAYRIRSETGAND